MSWRADVDTKSYIKAMNRIDKELLPKAITETVNELGRHFMWDIKQEVKHDMILKNKYTMKSFVIYPSKYKKGRRINRINCLIGSKSPYLPIHDEGGKIRAKHRKIAIPTMRARTKKSPRRPIAGKYRLNKLNMDETFTYKKKDKEFTAKKYFMGKPRGGSRRVGLYERYKGNRGLRMIRNLESPVVHIKPNHWFSGPLKQYEGKKVWQKTFQHYAKVYLKFGKANI